MKVLAINGSPQMDRGNTAMILGPFLDGMHQAGAEVEVLYTRKLHINPCLGDFACVMKTRGRCIQNDDMNAVYSKLCEADVWVLASPVYWDGISAPLKGLIDRLVAIGSPALEVRDGHSRHPMGAGVKAGKIVLVSNCGFFELDNFDPMLAHMRAISRNTGREFAGALLRPHGPVFAGMVRAGAPVGDVLEAAKQVGRQLVQDGQMSPEMLATISRPLTSLDGHVEAYNQRLGALLQAAGTAQ